MRKSLFALAMVLLVGCYGLDGAAAELSGEVRCGDCAGIVVQAIDPSSGQELVAKLLPAPGPYSFLVPDNFGALELWAYRDGVPSSVQAPVAYASNPVQVAAVDLVGLDLDIPSLPVPVVVQGTVSCTDCLGVIVTAFEGTTAGAPLAALTLHGTGALPYAFSFPAGTGDVAFEAGRDDNADGFVDAGAEVPYPANPVVVGSSDVNGVDIVLPPIPSITVNGSVTCSYCTHVTLALHGPTGLDDRELLAKSVAAQGAFTLVLPENLGAVTLFAYRDDDQNGVPDFPGDVYPFPQNPLSVATADLFGINLTFPAPPATTVISGQVSCSDCGEVHVLVHGSGGLNDTEWLAIALAAPGPYQVALPENFGDVTVFAARAERFFPAIDPTPYASNPVTVGTLDVPNVNITIDPIGGVASVTLSGQVSCPQCAGGVIVRIVDGADEANPTRVELGLPSPGPWSLRFPGNHGAISVFAYSDTDRNGTPEGVGGAYAANPITVGTANLANLNVTIPRLTPPPIVLSGVVTCVNCAGGVVVRVSDAATDNVLLEVWFATPGAWQIPLPVSLGAIDVEAYSDFDRNGVPDVGVPVGSYAGNSVTVATSNIGGVNITLDAPASLVLSGTLTCPDCSGGVVMQVVQDSQELVAMRLAAPGSWSIPVPIGLGDVEVFAYTDADGDGNPDPGSTVGAYPANPVTLGSVNVGGIDFTLSPYPPAVTLGGTVTCSICAGGFVISLQTADFVLAERVFDAVGPWSMKVPLNLGDVWVYGYSDADQNGVNDYPDATPYPFNPMAVGTADLLNLDFEIVWPVPGAEPTDVSDVADVADVAEGDIAGDLDSDSVLEGDVVENADDLSPDGVDVAADVTNSDLSSDLDDVSNPNKKKDDGCGCRVGAERPLPPSALLCLLLLLFVGLRARRLRPFRR